ncbi:hypothetical protein V1509DRAFT_613559 [Lipomyces kononenkoae]
MSAEGLTSDSAAPQRRRSTGQNSLNETAHRASGSEADHLLHIVAIQTITRKRAMRATNTETPWESPTSSLRELVQASQKDDLFTQRVIHDLRDNSGEASRTLYSLDEDRLLLYKRRLYIPQQRALIEELINLHHDDQLAGH